MWVCWKAPIAYREPTSLDLSTEERAALESWARRRKTVQGLALRARIVLLTADGQSNTAIAAELSTGKHTVGKWRERTGCSTSLAQEHRAGSATNRSPNSTTARSPSVRRGAATGASSAWPRPAGCRARRSGVSGERSACS